jgi:hypothetical protein
MPSFTSHARVSISLVGLMSGERLISGLICTGKPGSKLSSRVGIFSSSIKGSK